ncbi:MAG: hypothetical protein BWY49_00617 [Candidatus Omnitrophica bacterium ADurb.Bin314]|nr:MAG: hypothetical protein BWY49_00617 [Candidatus Omnitrophica bacterium ADurb.Bin314]
MVLVEREFFIQRAVHELVDRPVNDVGITIDFIGRGFFHLTRFGVIKIADFVRHFSFLAVHGPFDHFILDNADAGPELRKDGSRRQGIAEREIIVDGGDKSPFPLRRGVILCLVFVIGKQISGHAQGQRLTETHRDLVKIAFGKIDTRGHLDLHGVKVWRDAGRAEAFQFCAKERFEFRTIRFGKLHFLFGQDGRNGRSRGDPGLGNLRPGDLLLQRGKPFETRGVIFRDQKFGFLERAFSRCDLFVREIFFRDPHPVIGVFFRRIF